MSSEPPVDVDSLHHSLIDQLKARKELRSHFVESAFRAVPRHLFLPGHSLAKVYSDQAIPTKIQDDRAISSSSQPAIMAIMLEQLELQPGHKVLEIGAGTGYNAAIMAHIVGEAGQVTTIDLDDDIVQAARSHLTTAGFEQVRVVCGDGVAGYAANAPYDRIILTVGGWDISPHWLDQLAPGGRLLLPLSLNGPQLSVAFERRRDHLISLSVAPCGFMRLRGPLAEVEATLQLGSEPGLSLEFNTLPPAVAAETFYRWLSGRGRYWTTGTTATLRQVFSGLRLWLALHEPYPCLLIAQDSAVDLGFVPYVFGADGEKRIRMTQALAGESGIAILTYPPDSSAPLALVTESGESPPPFELYVRGYGPDKAVSRRLYEGIQSWDRQGQPGATGLRLRAYPRGSCPAPSPQAYSLTRRWHEFLVDWPPPASQTMDQREDILSSSEA